MRPLGVTLVGLVALAVACGRPPQAGAPDVAVAVAPPLATTQPVLLVTNKGDMNVRVLELPGGRVLATLPTGVGPHELAVSPDGRVAVVSDYGDQTTLGKSLTVIDVVGLKVAKTIDLGPYRRPHGVAFLPDGKRVVVTAEQSSNVLLVDLETGVVERALETGEKLSHMVALAPDGRRAWVANIVSGTVTALDLVAGTASAPVVAVPACEGIGVTRDGTEVWAASREENRIAVLDTGNGLAKVTELEAMGLAIRVTPTPDGTTMIVSNAAASTLQLFDVASKQAAVVQIPAREGDSAGPMGMTVANDSRTAYVTLVGEDGVAIVDLSSRTVVAKLSVGHGPDSVGYSDAFVAR